MTTLTVSKAKANLSTLLERAKNGEDIGIISGKEVVALRPVSRDRDYALREYGMTKKEMARFEKQLGKKISQERAQGKIKRFSGDLEKDLQD